MRKHAVRGVRAVLAAGAMALATVQFAQPAQSATTPAALVAAPQAPVVVSPQAVEGSSLTGFTAGGLVEAPAGAPSVSGTGFAQVGGCSFYATSAAAGGWCGASGVTGPAESLAQWLHGRAFDACRFIPVPDGMSLNAHERSGGTWMLKVCFEDVDLNAPWGGHNVNVDIYAQFVKDGTDTDIPGYMQQFWDYQSNIHYYPVPRITVAPSSPARVDSYTFFSASWVDALDGTKEAKPAFNEFYNGNAGQLTLHAQISQVTLYPGLKDMSPVDCGKADVGFNAQANDAIPQTEGGSQPSRCWTRYTHSTASRDENYTVQIRVVTYWHVTVLGGDGAVQADLGTFHYVAKQRLGVAEVQTVVDW